MISLSETVPTYLRFCLTLAATHTRSAACRSSRTDICTVNLYKWIFKIKFLYFIKIITGALRLVTPSLVTWTAANYMFDPQFLPSPS